MQALSGLAWKPRVVAPVVLFVVAGCVSLRVSHDFDPAANFETYQTYAWQESEVSLADDNPLMHQRIVDAIDAELSTKGLTPVDDAPDVYVAYYGESQEQVVLDRVGYYDGWYGWGGVGVSTVRARTYEEGTLVVDLIDADANRLVWRGVATDTLADSPNARTRQIQTAIRQMFRRFPPTD